MMKLFQDQLLQLVGCLALAGVNSGLSKQTLGIDFSLGQQQAKADILCFQRVLPRRPAFEGRWFR